MPEKKESSTIDFLNNIDKEVFKEEPVVEAVTEEGTEDDKPLPFHQDPKVQRYVEKQIEKAFKDRPVEKQFVKEVVEEINLPASFIKLVGNDTEEKKQVLKDLSSYFGSLKGEAKKEAVEEFMQDLQKQQQEAVAADKQAQEELDSSFEQIEENFDIDLSSNSASAKKLRSEFIDYVRKIAPKNEDGEVSAFPDLVGAFEDFQERGKRSTTPNRAKELAARGLTRSTDTSSAPATGRSWKDVDRFFSKLKSDGAN